MALHNLARFTEGQEPIYRTALAELEAGRKRSHWMWFIFPQLKGLGRSEMGQRYGIANLAEAELYVDNPVLGTRLRECVAMVLKHPNRTAHEIFGSPDDLKFRSCLTLFDAVVPNEPLFRQELDVFFEGKRDPRTMGLLNG